MTTPQSMRKRPTVTPQLKSYHRCIRLSNPLRRSRRSSQDAGHARPRRLLSQVVIIKQRGALPGERIRDPAVLVRDAPDGDADAAVHVEARAHHVREVVALRHQRAVGGRQG